jgi:hypothetical protein
MSIFFQERLLFKLKGSIHDVVLHHFGKNPWFYFILFYFILFYFILFYFIYLLLPTYGILTLFIKGVASQEL